MINQQVTKNVDINLSTHPALNNSSNIPPSLGENSKVNQVGSLDQRNSKELVIDFDLLRKSHIELLHAVMESLVISQKNSKEIQEAISRFNDQNLFDCIEYQPNVEELPIMAELVEHKSDGTDTQPTLDSVKKSVFEAFGGIKIRVLSPRSFVENNLMSISKMRTDYLTNDKKWNFPTLAGLDLGSEDTHSYHIVISANNTNMPLASVRLVIPRKPKKGLSDTEIEDPKKRASFLKKLEYMAANTLDVSPVDGKSSMDQLANSPLSKSIIKQIQSGRFHSIERLVLQSHESFHNAYPEVRYKFYVSVILPAIMSELAALSMASHINQSLVQCDPMFYMFINYILGKDTGVIDVGEIKQVKADGTDDTCFMGIVDFPAALNYTQETNPALSSLTKKRFESLSSNQNGRLLNYNLQEEL